ncbi:MAG: response regulator [Steroidobacteraceae bacterium]|jgi:CheY-like chemotaxis protein
MLGRILIIDDNPIDLRLEAELLELRGYQVDVASDAEQALSILSSMLPDLIVTDIALPGMDGLTLTRMLKADARLKRVPVVALTGFAMKGDAERAAAAGCDAYITKPIDPRTFAEQIAKVAPASRAPK